MKNVSQIIHSKKRREKKTAVEEEKQNKKSFSCPCPFFA